MKITILGVNKLRIRISILVVTLLILTGCNQGLSDSAETKIAFDLITDANNPILVTPTFLLTDSVDGTLALDKVSSDPSDLRDPLVAMGKTDGWSTSQSFVISFIGHDLDIDSVKNSFYFIKSRNPTIASDTSFPIRLTEEAGDYTTTVINSHSDGVKRVRIDILKPLIGASNYMFALTDMLKDSQGESVGTTTSYALLKSAQVPQFASLIAPQKITHAIEDEFAKIGVDKNRIIFSNWFTTASIGTVVSSTKAVIAETIAKLQLGGSASDIWQGEANPNNKDLTSLFKLKVNYSGSFTHALNNDALFYSEFGDEIKTAILKQYRAYSAQFSELNIRVYKGTLSLPYFLESDTREDKWKTTPWQSAVPSLAKIHHVLENGTIEDKAAIASSLHDIDIAKLLSGDFQQLVKLMGRRIELADGSLLDSERLIGRYSPIPKIKDVVEVPFILFMPATQIKPSITIYKHGVTSVKESAYLFAANQMGLAIRSGKLPSAIIAIDHPIHGERALSGGIVTTDTSVDNYINLSYLNVSRDNIRQSIIDDLGLRAAVYLARSKFPFCELNTNSVNYFGHSLGAITGLGTYRHGNTPLFSSTIDSEVVLANNQLFGFDSGAFANPGGGIASLLLESERYAPGIKHNLLLASGNELYNLSCGDTEGFEVEECYDQFFNSLDTQRQASISLMISEFVYATQTVLDTVDPYNLAATTTGPLYIMQVANDLSIPNSTSQFNRIGGGEPLNSQLGLSSITMTEEGEVRGVARFNPMSLATHTTAIFPSSPEEFISNEEAQTQIATFLADKGRSIIVNNEPLIE